MILTELIALARKATPEAKRKGMWATKCDRSLATACSPEVITALCEAVEAARAQPYQDGVLLSALSRLDEVLSK